MCYNLQSVHNKLTLCVQWNSIFFFSERQCSSHASLKTLPKNTLLSVRLVWGENKANDTSIRRYNSLKALELYRINFANLEFETASLKKHFCLIGTLKHLEKRFLARNNDRLHKYRRIMNSFLETECVTIFSTCLKLCWLCLVIRAIYFTLEMTKQFRLYTAMPVKPAEKSHRSILLIKWSFQRVRFVAYKFYIDSVS